MEKPKVSGLKHLADKLSLSVTTVSRVLNGKSDEYRISEATREKVLQTAKEENYTPNRLARGLKTNKTETIGLIIPDIANPYFSFIAKTIEEEARKKGFMIILCDSHEDIETETRLLGLLQDQKVDGIIIAPVGSRKEHLEKTFQSGMPLVAIDRHLKNSPIPFVVSDNYTGAKEGVEMLIKNGHKNIACIQGPPYTSPSRERVKGYEDALRNHRVKLEKKYILGNHFGEKNGYLQGQKLLGLQVPPTAIFALSNLISLGVLRAIQEKGLHVPNDISILSFDEQPYSRWLSTPMTTIEQPKKEIGANAMKLLLKQIENHDKGQEGLFLKTRLIERQSVATLENGKNKISRPQISKNISK
jgi:LacI family transcriptional regulator